MKIENLIVLSDRPKSEGNCRETVTGQRVYPIGVPMPVIVAKRGCIGIGVVTQYLVTATTTRVEFELNTSISKDSKESYYALFLQRNMSGGSNDGDEYDEEAFIPGAMGVGMNASTRDGGRRRNDAGTRAYNDIMRSLGR